MLNFAEQTGSGAVIVEWTFLPILHNNNLYILNTLPITPHLPFTKTTLLNNPLQPNTTQTPPHTCTIYTTNYHYMLITTPLFIIHSTYHQNSTNTCHLQNLHYFSSFFLLFPPFSSCFSIHHFQYLQLQLYLQSLFASSSNLLQKVHFKYLAKT